MKILIVALAIVGVVWGAPQTANSDFDFMSDEYIDHINSVQSTWKAGRNFAPESTDYVKNLMGVKFEGKEQMMKNIPEKQFSEVSNLPEHFDSRKQWPACTTIGEIRDQGACGSGWVFGAVETLSDRFCIHSNGTKNVRLSAENLLACTQDAGDGCQGGSFRHAWGHLQEYGVVTGGPYKSKQGCKPYTIPPCDHYETGKLKPCPEQMKGTPPCEKFCEPGYNVSYHDDLHLCEQPYQVSFEYGIEVELYRSGPVNAVFGVYSDFIHYKSEFEEGPGNDALVCWCVQTYCRCQIIRWPFSEDNRLWCGKRVKYWLVANSWNSDWGDKGFFKILKGQNECEIEVSIIAANPKLK